MVRMIMLLCMLTSISGQYLWQKHPDNPVLLNGPYGSWDHHFVFAPCVLPLGKDSLQMWYNGHEGYEVRNRPYQIGYAISADGVTWTKHENNPVVDTLSDSWRNRAVRHPKVIFEDGIYKMWLTGSQWDPDMSIGPSNPVPWHIGYLTSPDGVTWEEPVENPIFEPAATQAWANAQLLIGGVLKDSSGYRMIFNGTDTHWWQNQWTNYASGSAISQDGVNWVPHAGNPVFFAGSPGNYNTTLVNTVTHHGNQYELWYCQLFDGDYQICLATSEDGISWVPFVGNPIVSSGSSSEWDGGMLTWPGVVVSGPLYLLYYQSGNSSLNPDSKIGLALSLRGLSSISTPPEGYYQPREDSIHLSTFYYGDPDIQQWIELVNQKDSVIASVLLEDDGQNADREVGDSLSSGWISAPIEEGYYHYQLKAFKNDSMLIQYPDLGDMTNVGPVEYAGIHAIMSADSVLVPGQMTMFRINLTNHSSTTAASNVKARITPETPWLVSAITEPGFGNIPPGATVTSGGVMGIFLDSACTTGQIPITLEIFTEDIPYPPTQFMLPTTFVSRGDENFIPADYLLEQNYPNPFNPSTTISFQLPEPAQVTLVVYDIAGREIATLVDETRNAGTHNAKWNGLDDSGNQVSTGVYLCRLDAGEFNKTVKMLFLK